MKPVEQQFVPADPATAPVLGDCVRACVASILELDLADVPHFIQDARDGEADWWDLLVGWANARGYQVGCYAAPALPSGAFGTSGSLRHVIVTGPSHAGPWLHCVVYDGVTGQLAHDPNPTRLGLAGPPVDVIAFHRAAIATTLREVPA